MSDDERDIDVESDYDDDDAVSLGSGGAYGALNTQYMTQAEKRAHHNALERKRRDHIKESFSSLRDSIPSMRGDKVKTSRAQILKKASDYIQYMKKKNSSHQQDIEDLKRKNSILDQQVRALEKAKASGTLHSVNLSAILIPENDQNSAGASASEGSESSDSTTMDTTHKAKKLKV